MTVLAVQPLADPSERTALERAVLAALVGLRRESGGYLAALDLYAGELGASELDEVKQNLGGRAPAVLVSVGDVRYESKAISRRLYAATLDLRLFVVSDHLRSRVARAHGDEVSAADPTADPGINRILIDCRSRLAGETLGLAGFGPIEPVEEERMVEVTDISIVRAIYQTTVDIAPESPSKQPSRPYAVVEHRHHIAGTGRTNPTLEAEATVTGESDG